MNRRGFLASLRGALSSRSDGDPFFFGFQSVINVYGEDELRGRLERIIREAKPEERAHEKRDHYKRVTAVLRENVASMGNSSPSARIAVRPSGSQTAAGAPGDAPV